MDAEANSEGPRVAIVGGGVAGVETLLALSDLAGDRVEQTLVAPTPDFLYKPLLVEELFALIRRINGEGIALLLVEQNVVQCLEVARRAYILEKGMFVLHGNSADIRDDPNLKRAYLGL